MPPLLLLLSCCYSCYRCYCCYWSYSCCCWYWSYSCYCCYFCIYFCCYFLLLLLSLLLLMLLLALVLLVAMLVFDAFCDRGTEALFWQTVSVLPPPQSRNARYSSSFSVLRFFSFYAWVALLILSKTVFGVKIGTHHRLWAATEILLHPYRTSSHYISRY